MNQVAPGFEAPLPLPGSGDQAPAPPVETTETQAIEAPFGWWPWLLAAALAGLAAALVLRRRRVASLAGPATMPLPEPAAPQPRPVPPPAAPALPSGVVTTRLRPKAPAAPPGAEPAVPSGLIVSKRLRPWIDLELEVTGITVTEGDIVLRFRLTIANVGQGPARAIAVEATALNAGEDQGAELSRFYDRPTPEQAAIALLERSASAAINHEVRMPRSSLREYEHDGRRLFVPILAFNLSYRWSGGEGRTGKAFLLGHERRGAERLAPISLEAGRAIIGNVGSRLLDEALRR